MVEPKGCSVSTGIKLKGSLWGENVFHQAIYLSEIEYRLLCYLMERPNQPVSKKELLRAVWRYEWLECTNVVEVSIYRLRKKIEANPEKPQYVITQRGVGYQFVAPPFELAPQWR